MPEPKQPNQRKHRVLDWNPAAGQTETRRSGPGRKVLIVGGFLVGFCVVAIVAALVTWGIVRSGSGSEEDSIAGFLSGGAPATESNFATQARAELVRETAFRTLTEYRRLPQDHPSLLQQLILIEKGFLFGERLMTGRDYAGAVRQFEEVTRQIEDFGATLQARKDSRQLYDNLIPRLKSAERNRDIARQEYDTAFSGVGEGRLHLDQGNFTAARQSFQAAADALKRLEASVATFVEDKVWEGQQALNTGRRAAAVEAFQAALRYASNDESARRGLRRAETIDEVYGLLERGRDLEEGKKYEEAMKAYAKAFELDPYSAAAQEGKSRTEKLMLDTRFDEAMAVARSAEESRNWEKAIEHYEKAVSVYPDRDDVRKSLTAAKNSFHQSKVQSALTLAYGHERERDWYRARDAYQGVLELDSQHPEGLEGLIRTGRMIRTILEYEKLIEVARAQARSAQFQAAIRTFNNAMGIKPDYMALTGEVQELRDFLVKQNQPVEISFRSDGRTWVTISNFRLLGRFRETSLQMLPGDYEIVGRRKGYQDVLLLLQVRHGVQPGQISVVCTERGRT